MKPKKNPNRNIFKTSTNGKYLIRKTKDNKRYYFGTYDTIEDARLVRDVIESVGWGFRKHSTRNIQKCDWGYYLRKYRDGEYIYSESFKTLEEAQSVRDMLEECDWDIDALDTTNNVGDDKLKPCEVLFETHKERTTWYW